jgi:hypothetical protein
MVSAVSSSSESGVTTEFLLLSWEIAELLSLNECLSPIEEGGLFTP